MRRLAGVEVEHIVVDGGSTDGTVTYLENLDHIKVLHQTGLGISAALNQGLARATGKFVAVLNADDCYLDGIQQVLARLAASARNDVIFFADIIQYDPCTGAAVKRVADLTMIEKYMSLYHPCLFVPNNIYQLYGGYDEGFDVAMDCEFVHRCYAADIAFAHIDSIACKMRLRGKSHNLTHQAMQEFEKSVVKAGIQHPLVARWYRIRQTIFHSLFKQAWFQRLWLRKPAKSVSL